MAERHGAVELAPPPAPGEPIRVGIVSGFFYQHSVWKVGVRGWVTQLDPKRFQVFCYHTSYKQDAETAIARQHAHRFVQGPHPTEQWRRIIQADRPHVLHLSRDRHEPRGVGARGAAACAGAMQLHRPSADLRLSRPSTVS